jgi:lysozyme family protein
MTFDEAFDLLIGHEGGYANHPSDPGGETMWGITARVARQAGYRGAMRDLPRDTAKTIARNQYWSAVRAEDLPLGIRFDVFDTGYNSGTGTAIKILQRAVGVSDDGVFGRQTLNAVLSQKPYRISMRFNSERLLYLTSLSTWSTFGKGWARRVAGNLETAAENV